MLFNHGEWVQAFKIELEYSLVHIQLIPTFELGVLKFRYRSNKQYQANANEENKHRTSNHLTFAIHGGKLAMLLAKKSGSRYLLPCTHQGPKAVIQSRAGAITLQ